MSETQDLKKATTSIKAGIVMLTLITATVHLYLWSLSAGEQLGTMFLLNGLGYLGLLAAFFLPMLKSFRKIIGWTFFGYTLLTIIMWYFLGGPREGILDPFELTAKAVEATLAVQLILNIRH